jgi:hypothetical protein
MYFSTNANAILLSVDVDALLENQRPATANWGAAIQDESSESEGGSEGMDSPGQADPLAE